MRVNCPALRFSGLRRIHELSLGLDSASATALSRFLSEVDAPKTGGRSIKLQEKAIKAAKAFLTHRRYEIADESWREDNGGRVDLVTLF